MPISISKLPEVTNVKDNSFMLITQDGTTKRTMCDQFVTEEEARLDEFSPTVITSKSMSKAGEGDNVDYSSSVYDAPMKDVILKGKTMVNCIQEPSSQDVVLPYEFEDGQYVTINDTKESGALGVELKGQTLVNLTTSNDYTLNKHSSIVSGTTISVDVKTPKEIKYTVLEEYTDWVYFHITINLSMLKPNTKYIVMADMAENINYARICRGDGQYTLEQSYGYFNGGKIVTLTTNDLSNNTTPDIKLYLRVKTGLSVGDVVHVKNVRLIEYQDGMENWDIPYFEGMASCKMPILSTVGKNLFNYKNYNLKVNEGQNPQEIIVDEQGLSFNVDTASWKSLWYDLYLESGEKYTLSYNTNLLRCFIFKSKVNTYVSSELVADTTVTNATEDKIQKVTKTFTAPSTGFIRVRLVSEQKVGNHILQNFQIEKSSSVTTYEPHKSSILSLPEEVVLRSLPNGVCDTFNTRTGIYTQRIEEIIFDGKIRLFEKDCEDIEYYRVATDTINNFKLNSCTVNNMLPVAKMVTSSTTGEFVGDHVNSHCIHMRLLSSKLSQRSVSGVQEYLQSNPITVQYELATPIVTKINLSSTLKSWNTTTHIYSEIPENTLYPILSHSNPSYPVILKPSTKYSIVANSYSNNHTNSAINFNLGGATASTTVGNRVTTITTPSTLTSEELVMSGRGNKLNNVMVIEGDVVGDEPYFEGICDCKSPILLNCGKNLAKLTRSYTSFGLTFKVIDDTLYVDGTAERILDYYLTVNNCENSKMLNSLEVGTMVTLSNSLGLRNYFGVWRNGTTDDSWFANTMTIQNGDNNIRCFIRFDQGSTYNNQAIKIQLEATQNPTTYEPYKSNTTTFEQKDDKTIVLRSLPNGTCDTLNVETGEYVQRIEEITFDGSNEQWEVLAHPPHSNNTHYQFKHYLGEGVIGGNLWTDARSILSNTLPSANDKLHWNGNGIYGIGGSSNYIIITWKKDTCPFNDVATLNEWLSQNPTTVQYELATPIVTTVDAQGFPYAYKDGHVQLSSGSIEQSLTPKVEYNIATNRGGQITQNTKSLIRQGKLLDDIEDKINQIIEATVNDGIMLMKLRNK